MQKGLQTYTVQPEGELQFSTLAWIPMLYGVVARGVEGREGRGGTGRNGCYLSEVLSNYAKINAKRYPAEVVIKVNN